MRRVRLASVAVAAATTCQDPARHKARRAFIKISRGTFLPRLHCTNRNVIVKDKEAQDKKCGAASRALEYVSAADGNCRCRPRHQTLVDCRLLQFSSTSSQVRLSNTQTRSSRIPRIHPRQLMLEAVLQSEPHWGFRLVFFYQILGKYRKKHVINSYRLCIKYSRDNIDKAANGDNGIKILLLGYLI